MTTESLRITSDRLGDMSIASSQFSEVRKVRKERVINTESSPTHFDFPVKPSSRESMKSNDGRGRLDDPNFAPPPVLPVAEIKPMYEFNAASERSSNIPTYSMIRHSGYVMTRLSNTTMVTKKWKQSFWILYGECIHFFRSKEDFEEWATNPYLSSTKRAALIKRTLEFSPESLKMYKLQKRQQKFYRRSGYLHNFKLEKHITYGEAISPCVVGAFASMNKIDIVELHTIISCLLKQSLPEKIQTNDTSSIISANSSAHSVGSGFFSIRF